MGKIDHFSFKEFIGFLMQSGCIRKKRKKLRQRRDYNSSGRRRNNYYEEPTILKLCAIEGTRSNIDRCLNKLKKK